MIRQPGVSGLFYPSDPEVLKSVLKGFGTKGSKKDVLGVVAPHAGYVYSGQCAADVYSSIRLPETIIILGVDHRGETDGVTIDNHDKWRSPIGETELNRELMEEIISMNPLFKKSMEYGHKEHSIEVHIPLIQYFGNGCRIILHPLPKYCIRGMCTSIECSYR